eukprot:3849683-Rhodomonas_salina.2
MELLLVKRSGDGLLWPTELGHHFGLDAPPRTRSARPNFSISVCRRLQIWRPSESASLARHVGLLKHAFHTGRLGLVILAADPPAPGFCTDLQSLGRAEGLRVFHCAVPCLSSSLPRLRRRDAVR